jgi:hypothetical protein
MRKILTAIAFLAFWQAVSAQQALNNDSIAKLQKAGLSDDVIITTISASPAAYDISANGLIALKSAGVSDRVINAIVQKASANSSGSQPSVSPAVQTDSSAPASATPAATAPADNKPRVFLQSSSKGPNQNAERDQSMEMSKDLEKDCPGVRVTINQQMADYTIALNHIEVGLLVRDNQIQIANKDGDLISKTKEGGSIAGGMKKACEMILSNWSKKQTASANQ